jgi:hypothetical protein
MDAPVEQKAKVDTTTLILVALYGFCAGLVFGPILSGGRERRAKEEIRRHLERALERVED